MGDCLWEPILAGGNAAKYVPFTVRTNDAAGSHLIGMGYEDALIRADIAGSPPDERFGDGSIGSLDVNRRAREIANVLNGDATAGDGTDDGIDVSQTLRALNDRGSASEKGSLVIYPKVELRWNAAGDTLIQDTFIDLTNDYPEDVKVQMYFINGDAPLVP